MASIGFLLLFLLTVSQSFSQSISINLGPSQPYGLYASKDFIQTSAGIATKGFAVSVLLEDNRKAKLISPFIQITSNNNPIDQDALDRVYKFLKYQSAQATKPWNQTTLMGGGKINYYNNNFDLFAKAGVGLGWMSTYSYNLYDTIGVIKFNTLKVNALVLTAGLGANIYLKENVSVCLGYDFFYAKNNFGYEKYTNGNGPIKAAVAVEVKPDFQMGHFYAGIKFQLTDSRKK
ncbi:MAG: hypothetical protein SGJ00_11685 [bacterium]|nr:hypothetical protein [bacterium]